MKRTPNKPNKKATAAKTTKARPKAAKKAAGEAVQPQKPPVMPAERKTSAKPAAARKAAAKKPDARDDFGAPVDGFFAKQPPRLRAILDELRKLIEEALPGAESSLKWGMPFYTLAGTMVCALGGHKAHVNLILSGSPDAYADPEGRLTGTAKTGRHLKLTTLDELPRDQVRGWLRTAAALARKRS